MNKTKVSIVVPVYNVEKYIDRCVASLLNQTLQEIEVILVDDESPDRCPKICDEYAQKDKRVKVIHKKNAGLGMARNSGLDVASGEYVAFIDSDDFVELDMTERLYQKASEMNLDAIYTEFNTDDYPGIISPVYGDRLFRTKADIERLRLDIVGAEPTFKSCSKFQSSACKGLYSMGIIKKYKVRFYSEREYISEDMLFNLDFLQYAEKVRTGTWRFYHYCLNGSSLSHVYRADRWQKLQKMIWAINERADSFMDKPELDLRLTRTLLAYSKIAIGQEKHRLVDKKGRSTVASKIMNSEMLQERLKCYPVSRLPIRWRIYASLVKLRCVWLILNVV